MVDENKQDLVPFSLHKWGTAAFSEHAADRNQALVQEKSRDILRHAA